MDNEAIFKLKNLCYPSGSRADGTAETIKKMDQPWFETVSRNSYVQIL